MRSNSSNTTTWPEMAQAVNAAGRILQAQYGASPIPAAEIQREAERIGGYKQGGVIPSDYCYNLINKAGFSFTHPVLVRVGRGLYHYVGPDYAYTGPIVWTPKGGSERQVGAWTAGEYQLTFDPRSDATDLQRQH